MAFGNDTVEKFVCSSDCGTSSWDGSSRVLLSKQFFYRICTWAPDHQHLFPCWRDLGFLLTIAVTCSHEAYK